MFHSATLKLTTWYLTILIAVSLVFSVIIYSTASREVSVRIGDLRSSPDFSVNVDGIAFHNFREAQIHEAEANLLSSLIASNLVIWLAGGIGSYYLARRTLRPIEEAHEAQSRFTSDASHELRTPLASMKTELEVALRDPELKKEEMRELLVSNLEEVDKLTTLSQNLLQLSRLEHEDIEREQVVLGDIISSAAARYNKENGRIKITATKPYAVHANKASVEELLTILLDNALKYSPPGSTVEVRIIGRKQMAGFEVQNEGAGISPRDLPHIFDRFYRADASRTGGKKRGYGLGLSLAKKIVELNDGELTVSSGKDQLTTFRVFLPNLRNKQAENQ